MKPNEKVLVFPAYVMPDLDIMNAPSVVKGNMLSAFLLASKNLQYIDRASAEKDPSFKQIIPYVVIKDKDDIFRYRRSTKGGENRLHGKYSIGVGGHINPSDEKATVEWTYEAAMRREIMEEIHLNGDAKEKVLGTIYDPTDDVGKVHFGVVHLLELSRPYSLSFTDEALQDGDWMPLAYLKNNSKDFENWSKLVLENLL